MVYVGFAIFVVVIGFSVFGLYGYFKNGADSVRAYAEQNQQIDDFLTKQQEFEEFGDTEALDNLNYALENLVKEGE